MFGGYVQEKRASGNFPPLPPPSPVRIGKTLFVSELGANATAVREDVVYHYRTVDSAVLAAQDGDMIIVYPGQYNIPNGTAREDAPTIFMYCNPGVTLFGKVFSLYNATITGFADIYVDQDCTVEPPGFGINVQCNLLLIQNQLIITDTVTNINAESIYINAQIRINPTSSAQTYNINAKNIRISSTDTYVGGIYVEGGIPNSHVNITWQTMLVEGNNADYAIYMHGDPNNPITYSRRLKGNIIQNGTGVNNIGTICIDGNRSSNSPYLGNFFEGNITNDDTVGIHLKGSQLNHTGKIKTVVGAAVLLSTDGTPLFSKYISDDVKIVSDVTGIYYEAVGHKAILKNTQFITDGPAMDCPVPGAEYQLISGCATIAPTANVTNEIAGTTLLIDPLLIN